MKQNSIVLLTISLLSSFQIYSCSPRMAVAGTALVGALSAANVYRVYVQPGNDREHYTEKGYHFHEDKTLSHETRKKWSIRLGVVATIGVGFALRRATPMVRLTRAMQLLAEVKKEPVLRYHPLIKTPVFASEIQKYYVNFGLPYAEAFDNLKKTKAKTQEASELIELARITKKDETFGIDVYNAVEVYDQSLIDLMLAVKAQKEFNSEYLWQKKLQTDEKVADNVSIIAGAQMVQAINSFHHRH